MMCVHSPSLCQPNTHTFRQTTKHTALHAHIKPEASVGKATSIAYFPEGEVKKKRRRLRREGEEGERSRWLRLLTLGGGGIFGGGGPGLSLLQSNTHT